MFGMRFAITAVAIWSLTSVRQARRVLDECTIKLRSRIQSCVLLLPGAAAKEAFQIECHLCYVLRSSEPIALAARQLYRICEHMRFKYKQGRT